MDATGVYQAIYGAHNNPSSYAAYFVQIAARLDEKAPQKNIYI